MVEYENKTEDGKCIFCEIVNGNLKPMGNGTIYEDEEFIAWLSPFPNTKGATIVVPKKHYDSDVLEMPDEILSKFIIFSKKVAKILEDYFEDVGRIGLVMEGTGINHAHIKLFPMHKTGFMKKGEWRQFHSGVNSYFEEYDGYISSNDGPQADLEELEKLAKKIKDSY